jgi:hypothetical protein
MFGAFGECGIEYGLALIRSGIGVVPQTAVAGGKRYKQ